MATWRQLALAAALLALAGTPSTGRKAKPTRSEPNAGYVASDGRIRIVGYNDMSAILAAITRRIERRNPRLRFELDLKSTRSAPPALLDGASLLAPMGAEMQPAERAAFRARWCNEPVMIRVAHDSLTPGALSSPTGFLVRADNPLRSIDLRVARRVFAVLPGVKPVTQWGELGLRGDWAARPIHPIGLAADTAIGRFLLHGPLAADHFVPALSGKHQSRDVAAAVAGDPLAIGFANLNHVNAKLRALAIVDRDGIEREPDRATIQSGKYPLDRFLLVYARRGCSGRLDPLAQLVLADLLSDTGQAIIGADPRGYIPLNRDERASERRKLLVAGERPGSPDALVGSTPTIMSGLAEAWERDFNKRHQRFRVDFAASLGPPQGRLSPALERFLEGRADFAFLTREISEADLATFRHHHRADPVIVPVAGGAWNRFGAVDAVVIVVNAANPIRQLSFEQIDAIFSESRLRGGKPVATWSDLGVTAWRGRPLHIVGGDTWNGEESARALTIRRHVLSCCGLRGRWRASPNSGSEADVPKRVAGDPLAIGFTGFGHVTGGLRVVPIALGGKAVMPNAASIADGSYPLARTVDLLLPPPDGGRGTIADLALARYLISGRGQHLIGSVGAFIPLNSAQLAAARTVATEYGKAASAIGRAALTPADKDSFTSVSRINPHSNNPEGKDARW